MPLLFFASALAEASPPSLPALPPGDEVVVTASLLPPGGEEIPSATAIDRRTIEGLSPPLVPDLLRLSPGLAVATSGAPGAQTQVRIRGGEANHTLLSLDGIQFNDVAAGNEARFETLATDGLGRVEIVRGPQSALYGSEALGGVVALSTILAHRTEAEGLFELGARGNRRASARASLVGLTFGGAFSRDRGVDVLGGGTGDRDGYENRTLFLAGDRTLAPGIRGEVAARWIDHDNEFDGTDPLTFLRADTVDASRTRTGAVRGALAFGGERGLGGGVDAQYLRSTNRNRRGDNPLNRTRGERLRFGAEARWGGSTASALLRAEHEDEDFRARDQAYLGATDQDRSRARTALLGTARATLGPVAAEVALRYDSFSRFRDATTVRAGAIVPLGAGLSLAGSYGEGIAQPTFFDLFGFFPGSFRGNPELRPERSRGYEASLRYRGARIEAGVTGFSNALRDEIVSVFDPATFVSGTANATGRSRRRGMEAEFAWRPLGTVRVGANYTLLDARDQRVADGLLLREVRRPRHSGSLFGDSDLGRARLGFAASYVGARRDTDFDTFRTVTLDDYVLLSARAEMDVGRGLAVFVRGENLGDVRYQDVFGYRTAGQGVHAGLRIGVR